MRDFLSRVVSYEDDILIPLEAIPYCKDVYAPVSRRCPTSQ
jgi:hypothetical protein